LMAGEPLVSCDYAILSPRHRVGRRPPAPACRRSALPTLMAGVAASLAGWLIEDAVQPYAGVVVAASISLLVSTAVFVVLRKWLLGLRDG
jgi:hypothetical protein